MTGPFLVGGRSAFGRTHPTFAGSVDWRLSRVSVVGQGPEGMRSSAAGKSARFSNLTDRAVSLTVRAVSLTVGAVSFERFVWIVNWVCMFCVLLRFVSRILIWFEESCRIFVVFEIFGYAHFLCCYVIYKENNIITKICVRDTLVGWK